MSGGARDGLAGDTVYVPPDTTEDEETTPLGVKLCCGVGILLWFDHVTFLASAASNGPLSSFVAFTAFGTVYSCILYGLWTRCSWSWAWAMIWFTLVGALSLATVRYGPALVSFVLLVYLDDVESAFRDGDGGVYGA